MRTLAERTGLTIDLQSGLDEERLHPDIETLVFRITQEALTNVIRHASASTVHVRLHRRGDNPGAADRGRRQWLRHRRPVHRQRTRRRQQRSARHARDRAELFGGRIDLKSVPDHGTAGTNDALGLDPSDRR